MVVLEQVNFAFIALSKRKTRATTFRSISETFRAESSKTDCRTGFHSKKYAVSKK
jgi:hypothetical protein